METRYLSRPDQWDALVRLLAACPGPVAIDTEYETDDDFGPVHNADIHVWSLGWPDASKKRNARGIQPARAVVLPREALTHPPLVGWLEGPQEKWAHNAGVDRHAMANSGIVLGGVRDSLSLYRWLLPHRAQPGLGFSLDALGLALLGADRGKTEDFKDLVRYPRSCSCGEPSCLKRKGHDKTPAHEIPLSAIVEGHERWDRLVQYSGRDVLVGCELVQFSARLAKERRLPW